MSLNLFLLFYFFISICSYPQFKVIKHGVDDTWTIFKRLGNEQCSYYEPVDNILPNEEDYFLTLVQEEWYFAFYLEAPVDQQSWRLALSDCPEIDKKEFYLVEYVKSKATGVWTSYRDDSLAYVEEYDLDTCIDYENLKYAVIDCIGDFDYKSTEISGLTFIENPDNINCVDFVLQKIGSDVGDQFLFISNYTDLYCQYGYINSVCMGKTLIF